MSIAFFDVFSYVCNITDYCILYTLLSLSLSIYIYIHSHSHVFSIAWPPKDPKPPKAPKPFARRLMEQAEVILRFHSQGDPSSGVGGVEDWDDFFNALSTGNSADTGIELWFHVGYMNYSTFRFSGCRLQRRDAFTLSSEEKDSGLIHLELQEGDEQFCHVLQFLASCLNLDWPWSVEGFEIVANADRLMDHEMRPHFVEVRPFSEPGPGDLLVWKGREAEAKARKEKRKRATRARVKTAKPPSGPKPGRGHSASAKGATRGRGQGRGRATSSGAAPVTCDEGNIQGEDGSSDNDSVARIVDESNEAMNDAETDSQVAESQADELDQLAELFMEDEIETGDVPHDPHDEPAAAASSSPNVSQPEPNTPAPAAAEPAVNVAAQEPSDPPANLPGSRSGGPRVPREDVIGVGEFGEITFYSTTSILVATCRCPDHGPRACKKTKSTKESKVSGREGQGRPLGLLMAWLKTARHHADQHSHVHYGELELSRSQRKAAREEFFQLRGAARFRSYERDLRAGESDEPAFVP